MHMTGVHTQHARAHVTRWHDSRQEQAPERACEIQQGRDRARGSDLRWSHVLPVPSRRDGREAGSYGGIEDAGAVKGRLLGAGACFHSTTQPKPFSACRCVSPRLQNSRVSRVSQFSRVSRIPARQASGHEHAGIQHVETGPRQKRAYRVAGVMR